MDYLKIMSFLSPAVLRSACKNGLSLDKLQQDFPQISKKYITMKSPFFLLGGGGGGEGEFVFNVINLWLRNMTLSSRKMEL